MITWTWSDRLLVVGITLAFAGVGAAIGWLIGAKTGAVFGPVVTFPVAQVALIQLLKRRYAERPDSRS